MENKFIFRLIAVVFAASFISLDLFAQNTDSVKLKNNTLSFLPQYAVIYGVRIDYERRLNNSDLWLLIAPQYYNDYKQGLVSSSASWNNYYSLTGIGVNAYAKYVVYSSHRKNNYSRMPLNQIYLGGGPSYQHYIFKSYNEIAIPYDDNGVTLYKFSLEDVERPVNRFGGNINVGFQVIMDVFLLEIYLGVAYKISLDENGERISPGYAEWTDPTYSGIMLDGGLKLGLFF